MLFSDICEMAWIIKFIKLSVVFRVFHVQCAHTLNYYFFLNNGL